MIKPREFAPLCRTVHRFVGLKALRAPLLASSLLLLSGCSSPRTSGEPWVYAMSREFYPSMCGGRVIFPVCAQDSRCESAAIVMLAVFALPFAIDTVLLPVTVPHDLMLVR